MSTVHDVTEGRDATAGVEAAVTALQRGELVVLPTDTVYGIAADAFSPAAVQSLLAAKGRGRDMPVPVLVGAWRTLDGLTEDVPEQARTLVERFWPGGLTLVVRAAPTLAWDLGETRGTVAVRMPLHPVALAVLERTGPLAVSSANRSGQAPPTDAAGAQEQLGASVAVYLEAGTSGEAVPSTIVDLTADRPRVLRAGAVSLEELREALPDLEGPR
ncbi:MAG: threonylcarbamoyl-AMP synthase [Frankiales bacterium]|nr:threonylcarbamoyl-AMP synthase [Frankiales bacterium]